MAIKNELGRFGENVAAQHLKNEGWEILDRNWRCRSGELDIVARDETTVVFVEVKTRSGVGYGTPAEAITREKARRMRTLALHWLSEHRVIAPEVRFDVISVLRTGGGVDVDHIRGAF